MPTLITGAGGYIGRLLTLELSRQGEEVHAFVHTSKREEVEYNENIKVYWGDVQDAKGLEEAIKGCRKVYHLAALATNWVKDPDLFHKVNVEGTRSLLHYCKVHGVEKVVHTSSAAVIGPQPDGPFVDETYGADYHPRTYYEQSKKEAEDLVREYSTMGLNAVIVNPTRVFGPGKMSTSNAVTKIIQKYVHGKWHIIPANGKSMGNYAFAKDIVQGQIKAMEYGRNGERYLLGGENMDWNEFFARLAKVNGKKNWMVHFPYFLMLLISKGMDIYSKTFNAAPLITPEWVRKYTKNWGADCSKAINELGYEITPFEKALEETINWVQESSED